MVYIKFSYLKFLHSFYIIYYIIIKIFSYKKNLSNRRIWFFVCVFFLHLIFLFYIILVV